MDKAARLQGCTRLQQSYSLEEVKAGRGSREMHVTRVRTFSSAASTPVATESSCVRAAYSDASISSSVRTSRGSFGLSFLTRTFRVAMAMENDDTLIALQCGVHEGAREPLQTGSVAGGAGFWVAWPELEPDLPKEGGRKRGGNRPLQPRKLANGGGNPHRKFDYVME